MNTNLNTVETFLFFCDTGFFFLLHIKLYLNIFFRRMIIIIIAECVKYRKLNYYEIKYILKVTGSGNKKKKRKEKKELNYIAM